MGLYKGYVLKAETKTRRVEVRMTEDEANALERCAKKMKKTKSEVLMIGLKLVEENLNEEKKKA